MKTEALQALQHVRTTLAYQLTPEAVDRLLEPIQKALEAEPFHPVQPVLTQTHNAKVEDALQKTTVALSVGRGSACSDAMLAIVSLRL